ncbi:hypothetical protein QLY43_20535 [Cronobacter dublinensis]|uniref:hypothetical protein n=1 Tax=Cronobacter dublinensis TaxID=413497 RepID=UPI0024AFDBFF|nr:hypothetical protein [Cronobacter dublinensis]MDI7399062.1 hypothetical protein [Cronobacter dublinensis]
MERFIHKNIMAELERLGYDRNTALTGADIGLEHYRRAGHMSRKGKIFDDCLAAARQWAKRVPPG